MKRLYLAYGSNLNVFQMERRCPDAKIVGRSVLQDWQLQFRGSKTGAYLTIEPCKGSVVPVGVWEITEADEQALDRYEGFPVFYDKKVLRVTLEAGPRRKPKTVDAMVYIKPEDRPLGRPSTDYVEICAQGYKDFGFDTAPLLDAINRAWGAYFSTKGGTA